MSIQIENLYFSYGRKKVLEGLSFEVPDKCLCAVLGPNGAGKTTLFRCILGMLKKYSGEIKIDNISTKSLSAKELAHRSAYIPQSHNQTFDYRVIDMALMGTDHTLSMFSAPGRKETVRAEEALERVGILYMKEKLFSHLSGGEQQLVLVARALAQGSRTLLMDEPTSALDYGNQSMVLEQARLLADSGYCIFLSTHTPQHSLWYADTALALQGGNIAAFGPPKVVLNEELIENLYGVRTNFIETENGIIISPGSKTNRNIK